MAEATILGAKTGNSNGTGFGQSLSKGKLFWQRSPVAIGSWLVCSPASSVSVGSSATSTESARQLGAQVLYTLDVHGWKLVCFSGCLVWNVSRKFLSALPMLSQHKCDRWSHIGIRVTDMMLAGCLTWEWNGWKAFCPPRCGRRRAVAAQYRRVRLCHNELSRCASRLPAPIMLSKTIHKYRSDLSGDSLARRQQGRMAGGASNSHSVMLETHWWVELTQETRSESSQSGWFLTWFISFIIKYSVS